MSERSERALAGRASASYLQPAQDGDGVWGRSPHGGDGVSHDHDHHHHPLEAITHVHGGAMVLDIGGSVGALHVRLGEGWAGRELFLATDDPAFSVHAGVWLRHVDGGHIASALFPALAARTYRVLRDGSEALATVHVGGGELTEIDLRAAAPADTGR